MEIRIDKLLVDKQLAINRMDAERIIKTYGVLVNGKLINKTGKKFTEDAEIKLIINDERWKSIDAQKISTALDQWKIDIKKSTWIDYSNETCAASEVLLANGATHTICIPQHSGIIKEIFKEDERITILDRKALRFLSSKTITEHYSGLFIDSTNEALKDVLPFICPFLADNGVAIIVIKPQIEADKSKVNKFGLLTDTKLYPEIVESAKECAALSQLVYQDHILSPILGENGNKEFIGFFKKLKL